MRPIQGSFLFLVLSAFSGTTAYAASDDLPSPARDMQSHLPDMKFGQEPSAQPEQTASSSTSQQEIAALRAMVVEQMRIAQDQERAIRDLQSKLAALAANTAGSSQAVATYQNDLMAERATGDAQVSVGQPPDDSHTMNVRTAAIPAGQGVLTPAGHFSIEPAANYVSSSNNRLTFSGIELIPGLQLGVITAQTAKRDTFFNTLSLRYGINSRMELSVTVPAVYRHDNIEVVQQRDGQIIRDLNLSKFALGDVEMGLRYQLNPASGPDKPIWVLNLKVKSNTGIGPYDIQYDNFGIATGLATGSGFWAIEPGVSFLLPSDPVVIYGSLNYLYQFSKNINKDIGGALVQEVHPGGAVLANVGFGFALNPRFSFSLGYSHTYVRPTTTEIGSGTQRSTSLQVGTLDFGMSYRVTPKRTLNLAFQFGVTADAPNLSVTIRIPFNF